MTASSYEMISFILCTLFATSSQALFRQEISGKVQYDVDISETTTTVTMTITEGLSDRWYAMGFGQNTMPGAYVITYQPTTAALIERQLDAAPQRGAGVEITPNSWTLLSSDNSDINHMVAIIQRDNVGNGLDFVESSTSFPCIYATGPIDSNGDMQKHSDRVEGPCDNAFDPSSPITTSTNIQTTTVTRPLGYEPWETYFEHNAFLDDLENYRIYWTVDTATDTVEFGLEANSMGWIGFGISPNGLMPNSDVVVAWIKDNGRPHLENYYTVNERSYGPQLMDDQSNIEFIEGWRDETTLFFRFLRNIHPCSDHTVGIPTGTAQVIYAWNDQQPDKDLFVQHTHKGSRSINLLQGHAVQVPLPDQYYTFDVSLNNYEIPSDHTTYHCKLVEFADLVNLNHIVRVDSIVTPGNEGIVHHMLAFTCPPQYVSEEEVGLSGLCEDILLSETVFGTHCMKEGSMFYAWAIGGDNYYFPPHVGYEFGGSADDANQFILLQIHYDNPDQLQGVTDSSGLRIYYTPNLRENSASLLQIGALYHPLGMFVPPGLSEITVQGLCGTACTGIPESAIPQTGVNAFANMLHSHLIGKALRLRHIRGDQELVPMDRNDAYDFDYQQMSVLAEEIVILPGDQLLLECDFDSSKRDYVTWGGESSRNEMCFSFLYVYPSIEIDNCVSLFLPDHYSTFWGVAFANGWATGNPEDATSWNYDASTDAALTHYLDLLNNDLRVQQCLNSSQRIGVLPKGFIEYVDEEYCVCGDELNSGAGNDIICQGNDECCINYRCNKRTGKCEQKKSASKLQFTVPLKDVHAGSHVSDTNTKLNIVSETTSFMIFVSIVSAITTLMVILCFCKVNSDNVRHYHVIASNKIDTDESDANENI